MRNEPYNERSSTYYSWSKLAKMAAYTCTIYEEANARLLTDSHDGDAELPPLREVAHHGQTEGRWEVGYGEHEAAGVPLADEVGPGDEAVA